MTQRLPVVRLKLKSVEQFGFKVGDELKSVQCPDHYLHKFAFSVWVFSDLRNEPIRLHEHEYDIIDSYDSGLPPKKPRKTIFPVKHAKEEIIDIKKHRGARIVYQISGYYIADLHDETLQSNLKYLKEKKIRRSNIFLPDDKEDETLIKVIEDELIFRTTKYYVAQT